MTLPLPSRHLSPNGRVHWGQRARAVKQARNDGCLAALAARARARLPAGVAFPAGACLAARIWYRCRRRRDDDNVVAALKSYRDGLADARLVEDDSALRWAGASFGIDARNPRVELFVWPVPIDPA